MHVCVHTPALLQCSLFLHNFLLDTHNHDAYRRARCAGSSSLLLRCAASLCPKPQAQTAPRRLQSTPHSWTPPGPSASRPQSFSQPARSACWPRWQCCGWRCWRWSEGVSHAAAAAHRAGHQASRRHSSWSRRSCCWRCLVRACLRRCSRCACGFTLRSMRVHIATCRHTAVVHGLSACPFCQAADARKCILCTTA